jgi:hypothetical protein
MNLEIGDLVLGKKPWNQGAHLGVVIDTRLEQSFDTFRIFWINRDDNKLIPDRKTFLSWEVPNSVKRVANVEK